MTLWKKESGVPMECGEYFLDRIGFDEQHDLKSAETKIGRARDKDIIIKSKYCSVHQCIIEISGDGTITLTNSVTLATNFN